MLHARSIALEANALAMIWAKWQTLVDAAMYPEGMPIAPEEGPAACLLVEQRKAIIRCDGTNHYLLPYVEHA